MRCRHLLPMLILSFTLCGLVPGPAQAADTTPPVITHAALATAPTDANLSIAARITDESQLEQVTLYFRMQGSTNYYATRMTAMGGEFRALIPASYITQGGIEYYMRAVDVAGNAATWPVGGQAAPQRILVQKDLSQPQPELLLAEGTPAQPVEVLVYLNDAAGNVDPLTVRVLLNGKDITDLADISESYVSVTVTPPASDLASQLTIEATDRSGNRGSRTFTLWKDPVWQRELRVELESGAKPLTTLSLGLDWGPFSASMKAQSSDPVFSGEIKQPVNTLQLTYNTQPVTVAVGDVKSAFGPLSLDSLTHRGGDFTLRAGPWAVNAITGLPKQTVSGKDYQREVFGLRGSYGTDAVVLETGMVRLRDKWSAAGDIAAVNPEANYVLDAEANANLFGKISLTSSAALSLYHSNARGDLWNTFATLKANKSSYNSEIQAVIDMVDRVPGGLRSLFDLPDILLYGLPQIDTGAQVAVGIPVGRASLNLKGYRFGKDYQTIAGAAKGDALGFKTELTQIPLTESVKAAVEYEHKTDNVQSLVEKALDLAPLAPNAYQNYAVRLNYSQTDRPTMDLGFTSEEKGPQAIGVQEKTTGIKFGLSGYQVKLDSGDLRLGFSADRLSYRDLRVASGAMDKDTTTAKATANMDLTNWTADMGLGLKREDDGHGTNVVTGPVVDSSLTWITRQVQLLSQPFEEVRVKAAAAYDSATDLAGTQVSGKRDMSLSATGRVNSNLDLQAGCRQVKELNAAADNKLTASLRWSF